MDSPLNTFRMSIDISKTNVYTTTIVEPVGISITYDSHIAINTKPITLKALIINVLLKLFAYCEAINAGKIK